MKGWVGLVGWPIADGLSTVVTRRLQAERRTGSARRPKTGVLPTVLRNKPVPEMRAKSLNFWLLDVFVDQLVVYVTLEQFEVIVWSVYGVLTTDASHWVLVWLCKTSVSWWLLRNIPGVRCFMLSQHVCACISSGQWPTAQGLMPSWCMA